MKHFVGKRWRLAVATGVGLLVVACSGGNSDNKSGLIEPAAEGRVTPTAITTPVDVESTPVSLAVSSPVITLENAARLTILATWRTDDSSGVNFVGYTPDGARLVSYSASGILRVWDMATSEMLAVLQTANQEGWGAAVSPDGALAATTGREAVVQLWDLAAGRELRRIENLTALTFSVQFSPNSRYVALGYVDGSVELRDLNSNEIDLRVAWQRGFAGVFGIAFSPDGRYLATAHAGNNVVLWDAVTGERLVRLTYHNSDVRFVTFNRESTLLASTSADNTVLVTDVVTRQGLVRLPHPMDTAEAAFSRNGDLLATTGQDGRLRLWRLDPAEPDLTETVFELAEAVTDGTFWTLGLAFSPDGTRLVYGNSGGEIKILGVANDGN